MNKTNIKKYAHNTLSDMTNTNHFEFPPSEDSGHSGHPPSPISVLGGRIEKAGWMRKGPISLVLSLNVSN